jgi:hypothetical protein
MPKIEMAQFMRAGKRHPPSGPMLEARENYLGIRATIKHAFQGRQTQELDLDSNRGCNVEHVDGALSRNGK